MTIVYLILLLVNFVFCVWNGALFILDITYSEYGLAVMNAVGALAGLFGMCCMVSALI